MNVSSFQLKQFSLIVLLVSLWVHASEVFRYFVLVMPKMKTYWKGQEGIAEMNLGIFSIWGIWDTLLTALLVFFFWMYAQIYGNNGKSILKSSTISWLFVFVIFWVAAANMGYSDWSMLMITLPLSWLELLIATAIAAKLYERKFALG